MNFLKLMLALLIFVIALGELSATEISQLKWHMDPHGQELLIEQDDLHSEYINVSPKIDMGISKTHLYQTNKKVKVAIIDSGIDYNHPDLKEMLAYKKAECLENNVFPSTENDFDQNGLKGDCLGWNFNDENNDIDDVDGHGTHVAGLIADFFHAHKKNLEILPLRIFSAEKDKPLPIKLGKALEYAINEKVDLIHLSMGWPSSLMSVKLEKLIQKALDQDIMIVAAAGNSSQRANIYPCQMSGVLCVGALRANGEIAPFSNYGPQVDFMLPGERILSTLPTGLDPISLPIKGYDYKSGTSQAAPLLSGALLFLKALNKDFSTREIITKLFQSSPINNYASRGIINIEKAIKHQITPQLVAKTKELNTITNGRVSLSIKNPNQIQMTENLQISCGEKNLLKQTITIQANLEKTIQFTLNSNQLELSCTLSLGENKTNFILRNLKEISSKETKYLIAENNIIRPTRSGVRSRMISIPTKNTIKRAPLFYLAAEKNFIIYKMNKKIGEIELAEGCKRLRLIQMDLNADNTTDILYEELCEDKFLRYSFLDQELNELFPKMTFIPKLSIINYNDFDYILKNNLPHFRFINTGFVPASNDPWNPAPTGRGMHVYELSPKLMEGEYRLVENVLDDFKAWARQLGMRITPSFRLLNLYQNKILFKYQTKTYWFNLDTQKVEESALSQFLIAGDEIQEVMSTTGEANTEMAMSTLITPYEFRSHIDSGVTLRFFQENYYDPFMNVVAITKNNQGYHAFVKSYLNMHKLSFDFMGNFTDKNVFTIERFDFLNGDELDALLIPITKNNELIFMVDGTKVHTNYIDLIQTKRESFEIPKGCATQLPVVMDGVTKLVFACFEDGQAMLKAFDLPNYL